MGEWKVSFNHDAADDLIRSLQLGLIVDDRGRRLIGEQTVARVAGFKIEIFSNEHPPPHFRVIYQGESNNFTIDDCTPLNGNGLNRFFRNIRDWHRKNKHLLVETWNDRRPTDCPVGPYQT